MATCLIFCCATYPFTPWSGLEKKLQAGCDIVVELQAADSESALPVSSFSASRIGIKV
jgi:hypothetical protein